MIELCRRQLDFGDGLIAEEVGELWEDWMRHVDQVLEDPLLLKVVYDALSRRWTNSLTRGRKGTPVDVVLRMLVLKHLRNWSYAVLEREVRFPPRVPAVHKGRFSQGARREDAGQTRHRAGA